MSNTYCSKILFPKLNIISCIVLLVLTFTGCNTNSSTESSNTEGTSSIETTRCIETTSCDETTSNKEKTTVSDAEIMESLWSEQELNGYGILYYPDCELSYIEENSRYYPAWEFDNGYKIIDYGHVSREDNEDYSKPANKLLITNGSKSTVIYSDLSIHKYTGDAAERILFQDVTDDGVDDLIIRDYNIDTGGVANTSIYVLNGETFEEITVSDDLYDEVYDDIDKVDNFYSISDTTMGFDIYMYDGNIYKGEIDVLEYMKPENMKIWDCVNKEIAFVKDNKIYLGMYIALNYGGQVPIYANAILYELNYDEESTNFILTDNYQVEGNNLTLSSNYTVINEELYEEAKEKWNEYKEEVENFFSLDVN